VSTSALIAITTTKITTSVFSDAQYTLVQFNNNNNSYCKPILECRNLLQHSSFYGS